VCKASFAAAATSRCSGQKGGTQLQQITALRFDIENIHENPELATPIAQEDAAQGFVT
jgi:hypothetical protein